MSASTPHVVSRITGSLVGGFVILATVPSCGDAEVVPVMILGILAPPTPTGSGTTAGCVYVPAGKGLFLSFGTVDFAFTRQYTPVLLLANQLIPHRSPTNLVTPTGIVLGADVRVTDADGNPLDSYTVAGAGFLAASAGNEPGLGAYETTLVSSAAADKLGMFSGTRRLVSYVKVHGTTYDGARFESGEAAFPINVCIGCLVTFPVTADDPASATQPNCDASSSTAITSPCVVGQDQPIDCRLCASTNAPFAPPNMNVCEP